MAFNLKRSSKEPMSEINVTPFVDVMLVLLIIFMVTAPLLTVGIQVDLPESSADSLPEELEPLTLSIDNVNGSNSSGSESAELSGRSTCIPTVNNGAVTINIINNTNITSTNGVTFISLIGSFDERLRLKAILYYW